MLLAYFGLSAVRALRVASFVAWRLHPVKLEHPLYASAAFTGIAVFTVVIGSTTSWVRSNAGSAGALAVVAAAALYGVVAVVRFDLLPHDAGATWRTMFPGALLVALATVAIHAF